MKTGPFEPPTTIRVLARERITAHLEEIAELRVRVFREYPYRYQGSADYERDYLAGYATSPNAVVVVAEHSDRIVGASTGLPLIDADPAFRRPFERHGPEASAVFYFGESVLLPAYRGRGAGHRFFDERQRHAAGLGFEITAFCAVDRPDDDPHRPPGYRGLEDFWIRRGYVRHPELVARFDWREIGADRETTHRLTFWLRCAA